MEALDAGVRPLAGPICRDCLRLIPRIDEDRWDVPISTFCLCGNKTTVEEDERAHGIVIGFVDDISLLIKAKVRE